MQTRYQALWMIGALLIAGAVSPARASELVELKDGQLLEADTVEVVAAQLVLRTRPGPDGTERVTRLRMRDVDPWSAARSWADTLGEGDVEGWLDLATFARENSLFDVAEHGYVRAAAASPIAGKQLEAYRQARPREESRFYYEEADGLLRDKQTTRAAAAARAAIRADDAGPYGLMATELLDILSGRPGADAPQPKTNSREVRRLDRLERYAQRAGDRLRAAKGQRVDATGIQSSTQLLDHVEARVEALTDPDVDAATRQRATTLLADVRKQKLDALLLLADLSLTRGERRRALTAVHGVLALEPAEPLALDLRERLLDSAEWERRRERDLLWRGARRQYHPYPYPARDNRTHLGLEPTWDPIRGIGRVPYTAPRWGNYDDDDGGDVVVANRPNRPNRPGRPRR